MKTTSNLELKKPEGSDVVNVEDLNGNFDVLDAKFGSSGHTHDGTTGNGPQITSSGLADGSVTDAKIGNRTISDTSAPTADSGTLTTLLGWIGNMIKAITGKPSWRTVPATTLERQKRIWTQRALMAPQAQRRQTLSCSATAQAVRR